MALLIDKRLQILQDKAYIWLWCRAIDAAVGTFLATLGKAGSYPKDGDICGELVSKSDLSVS